VNTEILKSLVIIFSASMLVVYLLHKINLPTIVGFLVAGIIIGPHGLELVKNTASIEIMAEIGIILLLFTIGIEFSMAKLSNMKKTFILGGGAQVLFTIALAAVCAYIFTRDISKSVFFGFIVALSSTAIVLKTLSEKAEIDSPHGRIMTGILIFQDLCVVPLMLLIPTLSGGEANIIEITAKLGKAILIIALVILSSRWFVPRLLHLVVHTRSRELFMTTIILLCLGTALLTSKFGLSLALGAFLAGLVISESEYAHQVTSDILPFKDSFIGLFFVSIGLMIDIHFISAHLYYVAAIVAAIIVLKTIATLLSIITLRNPLRISLNASIGLAQIGEFSFVLAIAGKSFGLLTENFYQIFLSSSVITMALTPFLLKVSPSISAWIISSHLLHKAGRHKKIQESESYPGKRQNHVIIVGFGLNGKNLARVLKDAMVPYVILEMNSDTVRAMKHKGEPIFYGDGTGKDILRKLNIDRAKLLVIAISDPSSARRIVAIARDGNPNLHIIVRTKYLSEVDDLKALGADEVIPEEFETSIEIFSRVLSHYNFPPTVISDMADRIRNDNYNALRNTGLHGKQIFEKSEWLSDLLMDGYKIPEDSVMADKSIADLQIRKTTGTTIIAVRREDFVFTNPNPDFKFKKGDMLIFTGDRDKIQKAVEYFRGKEISSET
jgi:CPA2 family monovalent cation:H+ antiporter-2